MNMKLFALFTFTFSLAHSISLDELKSTGQFVLSTANDLPASSCPTTPDLDPSKKPIRVAMGTEDFKGAFMTEMCGKCLKIQGTDGSVVATIVSSCGGDCKPGSIQLNADSIPKISKSATGPIPVKWEVAPCSGGGSNASAPAGAMGAPPSPVGGNKTAAAGAAPSGVPAGTGFKLDGTKIIDNNGKEFIAKGVNHGYGFHPEGGLAEIPRIAESGANIIRIIVLRANTGAQLAQVIEKTLEFKMVPMVALWDVGSTSTSNIPEFYTDLGFWLSEDWKTAVQKNQDQILINISNEFGHNDLPFETWRDIYLDAIKKLRDSGYTCPLVIDVKGGGEETALTNVAPGDTIPLGQRLLEADPLKNIIFSYHLYGPNWVDAKLDETFNRVKSAGFPWIIGEHGNKQMSDFQINNERVYELAQQSKIGVIAWSWFGNGDHVKNLDMNTMDPSTGQLHLNDYGKQIIDGKYGLRSTSQKAEGIRPAKQ